MTDSNLLQITEKPLVVDSIITSNNHVLNLKLNNTKENPLDKNNIPTSSDFKIVTDTTVQNSKWVLLNTRTNEVNLVVDQPIEANQFVTVSYMPETKNNNIVDQNGNVLASFDISALNKNTFTGQVVNTSSIRDASIYVDWNENGVQDDDEPFTTTDTEGFFTIQGGGSIHVTGGYDIFTSKASFVKLDAPFGYSTVNPVSTLAYELLQQEIVSKIPQSIQTTSSLTTNVVTETNSTNETKNSTNETKNSTNETTNSTNKKNKSYDKATLDKINEKVAQYLNLNKDQKELLQRSPADIIKDKNTSAEDKTLAIKYQAKIIELSNVLNKGVELAKKAGSTQSEHDIFIKLLDNVITHLDEQTNSTTVPTDSADSTNTATDDDLFNSEFLTNLYNKVLPESTSSTEKSQYDNLVNFTVNTVVLVNNTVKSNESKTINDSKDDLNNYDGHNLENLSPEALELLLYQLNTLVEQLLNPLENITQKASELDDKYSEMISKLLSQTGATTQEIQNFLSNLELKLNGDTTVTPPTDNTTTPSTGGGSTGGGSTGGGSTGGGSTGGGSTGGGSTGGGSTGGGSTNNGPTLQTKLITGSEDFNAGTGTFDIKFDLNPVSSDSTTNNSQVWKVKISNFGYEDQLLFDTVNGTDPGIRVIVDSTFEPTLIANVSNHAIVEVTLTGINASGKFTLDALKTATGLDGDFINFI